MLSDSWNAREQQTHLYSFTALTNTDVKLDRHMRNMNEENAY